MLLRTHKLSSDKPLCQNCPNPQASVQPALIVAGVARAMRAITEKLSITVATTNTEVEVGNTVKIPFKLQQSILIVQFTNSGVFRDRREPNMDPQKTMIRLGTHQKKTATFG